MINKKLIFPFLISCACSAYAYGGEYIVKKGDTLSEVVQFYREHKYLKRSKFEDDLKKVLALNSSILNSNIISVGQKIILPSDYTYKSKAKSTYEIKFGDTFFEIAEHFVKDGNIWAKINQLKKYNPQVKNIDFIKSGDFINIPASEEGREIIDEKTSNTNIRTYRVLDSDTFSSIIKKYSRGSKKAFNENANAIRLLNPQIQNINELTVGQLIYLPTTASTRDITSSPKDQVKETDSPKAEENEYWSIGVNYGSKYLNLSQTGVLGNADIGAIVPKSINLYSQYHNGDYSFGVNYESYALKYKANGVSESQDFNSFNLLFGYRSLVTGFEFSEEPLFKNDNGTIVFSKFLTKKFKLGFIKEWDFGSNKPTSLEFSSILDYQFEGDSSDKDIEVSKTSGYGVKINTTLKRELYRKPSYQVFVVWPTFMNYQENSSTINWGASSGESKSIQWEVGTQLGIEIKF